MGLLFHAGKHCIGVLVQNCSNSIAMELLQFCAKPSVSHNMFNYVFKCLSHMNQSLTRVAVKLLFYTKLFLLLNFFGHI